MHAESQIQTVSPRRLSTSILTDKYSPRGLSCILSHKYSPKGLFTCIQSRKHSARRLFTCILRDKNSPWRLSACILSHKYSPRGLSTCILSDNYNPRGLFINITLILYPGSVHIHDIDKDSSVAANDQLFTARISTNTLWFIL